MTDAAATNPARKSACLCDIWCEHSFGNICTSSLGNLKKKKRLSLKSRGCVEKREWVGKRRRERFCFTRSRFDLFNEVDVALVR